MFKALCFLVLCLLFLASVSTGQNDEHPVSARMKELLLIQRAETGDTRAQSEITKQAQMGDPQAEAALGDNYEYGLWVARDHVKALAWYRKAAVHGDIGARHIIGQMYFDGDGVKQDFTEAARWFGCPKPSETTLVECKAISYRDLPTGARDLLNQMKCQVHTGSNYDYGSAVNLGGNKMSAYEFCCSESPHGPCGAVVIGQIGGRWKVLSPKEGLLGFYGACNGFIPLVSRHNELQDVCLPSECSMPIINNTCRGPAIWQFSNGRYQSVPYPPANKPRQ